MVLGSGYSWDQKGVGDPGDTFKGRQNGSCNLQSLFFWMGAAKVNFAPQKIVQAA